MAELLIELFSEEIPARMQDQARADLARLVGAGLAAADLAAASIRTFATPRRLTLVADGIPTVQPDRIVERRGPRIGAPEQARAGFFASLKDTPHRLEERDEGKKGRVLYALIDQTGAPTAQVIKDLLDSVLPQFPWPKSMRWGEGEARWVRPLHAMICLFDGEVVPAVFGGITAGRTTFGHRFMAPEPIEVTGFVDYADKLQGANVVLDQDRRRTMILDGARALAERDGLVLQDDVGLIDELKGLVEWPVLLIGKIEPRFMDLPPEVLVTSMRTHQRYLSTRHPDGALADRFITVANMETADQGATIIAGNERVLRARLWDAAFFWDKDREQRLESRLPQLAKMVFHAKLGTLADKTKRLEKLAGRLGEWAEGGIPGASSRDCVRAAEIAKSDLTTGMVGEFPELQGIMGGHYARHEGQPDAVADAIAEQYRPAGPDDYCPAKPTSYLLGLADRIDTLVGFFGIGIRPTGSKDPFALRRAAQGIIRLITENRLRELPLKSAIEEARELYLPLAQDFQGADLTSDVVSFIFDRMKAQQLALGGRHDLIDAVLGYNPGDDLLKILGRIAALQKFLSTDTGANLLAGWRRASNIVAIEEKRDGEKYDGEPVASRLADPTERALLSSLNDARGRINDAWRHDNFIDMMRALALLRTPVDQFFDAVLVNTSDPELRRNRLLLLSRIRSALDQVADFSKVRDAQVAPV